jgi:hypothetical protein
MNMEAIVCASCPEKLQEEVLCRYMMLLLGGEIDYVNGI